jgi:hypothetical protein
MRPKRTGAVVLLAMALISTGAAHGAVPVATVTAPTPISGGGGWLVWSVSGPGGWTLEAAHDGVLRPLALAPRPQPFDASVGTDGNGRPVVTFSRCTRTPRLLPFGSSDDRGGTLLLPSTGAGCKVHSLELEGGPERTLPIPHPPAASDTTPAMWHGAVAFGRRARPRERVGHVMLWSPAHPRRLATLPRGAEPDECDRLPRCEEPPTGEVQALAFQGGLVAFVWSPGGQGLLGEEAWEDRIDRLSAARGVLAGSQLGVESCAGGSPVEESYPVGPVLAGGAAVFSFYERGSCFTRFGTGLIRYRAGALSRGSLTAPSFGLASDGHSLFALVARVPSEAVEAECSQSSPCTLERISLPRLRHVTRRPAHPFV